MPHSGVSLLIITSSTTALEFSPPSLASGERKENRVAIWALGKMAELWWSEGLRRHGKRLGASGLGGAEKLELGAAGIQIRRNGAAWTVVECLMRCSAGLYGGVARL
ncbi:hypothetical protein M0R45_030516 [Rubus argutus]|uniref:Uncharacterized protein n=1 Tax=Rubus argutus TaxID=59490 RepID=A0AAW1WEG5_RUBAR